MTDHKLDSDFIELCEILDRNNLTDNQIRFLAADILVGDISLDYYFDLKSRVSSSRISANAQKVIDHVNKVKQ